MNRPNILLISLDSLRADHLPMYGYSRTTSPHLQQLCTHNQTTLFKNAYATTTWTLPSHTSVFTGREPAEHGIFDKGTKIDPAKTLPKILNQEGYQTAAFINNAWLTQAGITDGFDDRFDIFREEAPSNHFRRQLNRLKIAFSLKDNGAKSTINQFEKWEPSTDSPWFSFVHFNEPHYIYNPPRKHQKEYLNGSAIPSILKQRKVFTRQGHFYADNISISDTDMNTFIDLYDGEVKYIDKQLNRLFEYLKQAEEWENTLIIVFADHGELFGERELIGHHFCLANALLHIPLIIKWPEADKQHHAVIESAVSLKQTFDTVLEATEIDHPSTNALQQTDSEKRTYAFADYRAPSSLLSQYREQVPDFDFTHYNVPIQSVQNKDYKLVVRGDKEILYEITNEYREDSISKDENKRIYADLKGKIDRRSQDLSPMKREKQGDLDSDVQDNLESMGYL